MMGETRSQTANRGDPGNPGGGMMGDPSFVIRFILAGLAVYRVAQLFHYDEGPPVPGARDRAGVFLRLRVWAGVYDRVAPTQPPRRALGRLLDCPFCLGIWAAGPATVAVILPGWLGDAVLVFFAVAGLQTLLQTRSG